MTVSHDHIDWWKKNMSSSSDFGSEYFIPNNLQNYIKSFNTESMEDAEPMIRRFPSGAVRSDDRGRIRPDFVSPYALSEIAAHFTNNENDFGATNYFKGIKPQDIMASLSRHYVDIQIAYAEGDKDKLREEFRAIAANCVMALHQIVLEEKGLYKEVFEKTEYVTKSQALKDSSC